MAAGPDKLMTGNCRADAKFCGDTVGCVEISTDEARCPVFTVDIPTLFPVDVQSRLPRTGLILEGSLPPIKTVGCALEEVPLDVTETESTRAFAVVIVKAFSAFVTTHTDSLDDTAKPGAGITVLLVKDGAKAILFLSSPLEMPECNILTGRASCALPLVFTMV